MKSTHHTLNHSLLKCPEASHTNSLQFTQERAQRAAYGTKIELVLSFNEKKAMSLII